MAERTNIISPVDAHAGQKEPEQVKSFLEVVRDRWGARYTAPECPSCGAVFETHTSDGKDVQVRVPCPCETRREAQEKAQSAAAAKRRSELADWRSTCKRLRLAVPAEYAGATLETLDDDVRSLAGKAAVARYLADVDAALAAGRGLSFFGDIGTGKSTVMAALVNELQARGYRALFLTVGDLLSRLRDFGRKDAAGVSRAQEVADLVRDVDFLALDELGREASPTQWALSELFAVLNDRYAGRKAFGITSNQTIAGLRPRYVRILSKRMRDEFGDDSGELHTEAALAWDVIASRITQRCEVVGYVGGDRRAELAPNRQVG